ncbi:hypothetical protein [Niallia taxi]|uniref:hypothetical protein n=1 Tax=Niallia taxi TaxID=2499688 RepID=UPI0015F51405|nr:hypothetical protein [Niallia taxi]
MKTENIGWILHNSVNDGNRKSRLPKATDEELFYCLAQEKRAAGISSLLSELRKRGAVSKGRKLPDDVELLINEGNGKISYCYTYATDPGLPDTLEFQSVYYSYEFSKEEFLDTKQRNVVLDECKMYMEEHDTVLEAIQYLVNENLDKPIIFVKESFEEAYDHLINNGLEYILFVLPDPIQQKVI